MMTIWDVQHGNAIYINTPNDKHLVIDLGRGDYSGKNEQFSPLDQLRNRGIRQLDHVTITHPHLDHIDDILQLDTLEPKVLCTTWHLTDEEIMQDARWFDRPKYEKYLNIRRRYNQDATGSFSDTNNPSNFGGVVTKRFTTFGLPHNNFNNHSILTVMEYAGVKIVIPGDNECASLTELMKKSDFREAVKNSALLIAPHHGRQSAYHNEFVSLVNPYLTVVSDGRFCDTSANGSYSAKSRGKQVW